MTARGSHASAILALVAAAAVLPLPREAAAQRLEPVRTRFQLEASTSSDTARLPGTAATIGAGLLGGMAGLFVGVIAGSGLDKARGCDECDEWGTAAGAFVGSTLGVAGAVHLVHYSRGRFLPVAAWTAGVLSLALLGSYAASRAGADVDVLALPASFLAATWMANRAEHVSMRPSTVTSRATAGGGPD